MLPIMENLQLRILLVSQRIYKAYTNHATLLEKQNPERRPALQGQAALFFSLTSYSIHFAFLKKQPQLSAPFDHAELPEHSASQYGSYEARFGRDKTENLLAGNISAVKHPNLWH